MIRSRTTKRIQKTPIKFIKKSLTKIKIKKSKIQMILNKQKQKKNSKSLNIILSFLKVTANPPLQI